MVEETADLSIKLYQQYNLANVVYEEVCAGTEQCNVVDEQQNLVDEQEHLVDEHENLVDEQENSVDEHENLEDEQDAIIKQDNAEDGEILVLPVSREIQILTNGEIQ